MKKHSVVNIADKFYYLFQETNINTITRFAVHNTVLFYGVVDLRRNSLAKTMQLLFSYKTILYYFF